MNKFTPLYNYVLVQPIQLPDQTEHGILLPEVAKDKPNQGKIIAVGDGLYTDAGDKLPLYVKVGDTVLFPKYSGTELKFGKDKYLVMRETDLFGTLSD